MTDRQGGEFLPGLPLGGERSRPAGIAVEAPFLVGDRESAVRAALQQEIAADPQDEQIHVAVAIDVEGIGAENAFEFVMSGIEGQRLFLEAQGSAGDRFVDEQLGRILAAGQKHRRKARTVAIERRPAAADEILPRPVVDAVEAGRDRFLMQDRNVAERLLRRVLGENRAGE